MQYEKADESVRNLVENYRSGELILSPSFQRGYVWNIKQASKLIESVLLSIPLPSVYLYEAESNSDKTIREVIDGKQRLTTLIYFVLGKSVSKNTKKFKLVSKYPELNGKTFQDLTNEQKKKICATKIRTTEIPSNIPPEVKYTLFERVNVGSVPLNAQEVRNCVSRGSLNDWLNNTAQSALCDRLMGDIDLVPRMERQETLLKLCYLNAEWNGLGKMPFASKTKLDAFMRLHANHTEKDLEGMFKSVTTALKRVLTTIGEETFHHRTRGYDQRALMATAAWFNANKDLVLTNGLGDRIREAFEEAKAHRDFRSPAAQVKSAIIIEFLDSCLEQNTARLDPNRRYSRAFAEQLFTQSVEKCCAICNNKILSFDDCEVDHRTPWALGGRTDAANAQLTHTRCNRQKGCKESFNA